jgi:uncharacterized protein
MTMSPIDQWYAAIRSGDAAALAAVVTADIELLWNGDPSRLPWAGKHVGVPAVIAFFETLGREIEVLSVTPLYRLDAGDAVVVALEGCWRSRSTQREIQARACNVFRLKDGKISSYEVYNDSGRFVAALSPKEV